MASLPRADSKAEPPPIQASGIDFRAVEQQVERRDEVERPHVEAVQLGQAQLDAGADRVECADRLHE